MDKILISACLIGDNTKFDGGNNRKEGLLDLLDFYELVPFCPEVEGGLPTPRRPSEIRADRVRNDKGDDVSKFFNAGADKAVSLCRLLGIQIAVLKERSPSCGTHQVHNGLFNGILVKGMGIAAGRLAAAGIRVMNEDEAMDFIKELKENKAKGEAAKAAAKERQDNPPQTEEKSADQPVHEERKSLDRERKPYKGAGDSQKRKPYSQGKKEFRKPYEKGNKDFSKSHGDGRRTHGKFHKDERPHDGSRPSYKGKGDGKPRYPKKDDRK